MKVGKIMIHVRAICIQRESPDNFPEKSANYFKKQSFQETLVYFSGIPSKFKSIFLAELVL